MPDADSRLSPAAPGTSEPVDTISPQDFSLLAAIEENANDMLKGRVGE